MSATWYVLVKGEEIGPISSAQLRQMAAIQALTASDQVRQDPAGQWVPAKAIKGLFQTKAVTTVTESLGHATSQPPLTVAKQPILAAPNAKPLRSQSDAVRTRRLIMFTFIGAVLCLGAGYVIGGISRHGAATSGQLSHATTTSVGKDVVVTIPKEEEVDLSMPSATSENAPTSQFADEVSLFIKESRRMANLIDQRQSLSQCTKQFEVVTNAMAGINAVSRADKQSMVSILDVEFKLRMLLLKLKNWELDVQLAAASGVKSPLEALREKDNPTKKEIEEAFKLAAETPMGKANAEMTKDKKEIEQLLSHISDGLRRSGDATRLKD